VSTTDTTADQPQPRVRGTFYTVKTGDTLAGIAETVGIPVERLQELNPDLDPQALVSGQKIRLRE
jgi:LysM repeat protein